MSETIETLQPTPPEPDPAETLTPEVSFLRGFLGKISEILRDDAASRKRLGGSARLVAEMLDRTGKPFLFKAEHEKISQWQEKADDLAQVHLQHTNEAADKKFHEQLAALPSMVSQPGHQPADILSREEIRRKFELVRTSARIAQQKLCAENLPLAKKLAYRVERILLEELPALEESERERFASFGLTVPSPIPGAVRAAAKFVSDRVAIEQGTLSPRELLPWLLL